MFEIVATIVIIVIVYRLIKPYTISLKDTVIAFTGGLGAGKTFMSAKCAVTCYKRAVLGWRLDHIFHPIKIKGVPPPQLYSSIPIRLKKGKKARRSKKWKKGKEPVFSNKLTPEILLLQERINPRSVILIDELGSFMNQFEFKAVNSDLLDEFVRLFRHYTLGGKLIVNDQCSENIVLHVRRRLNTVYNLMQWRKIPLLPICHMKCRHITVSEEMKTVINDEHVETAMQPVISLMPLHRLYDTHCYSRRYQRLPEHIPQPFTELKKDDLLKNPGYRLENKIDGAKDRRQESEPPVAQPPASLPPVSFQNDGISL